MSGDDSIFSSPFDFSKEFEVTNEYFVQMVDSKFDMDIFSESEIECIQDSIEENKNLSFKLLRDKSHDFAWKSANRDESISAFDIARSGGANDELLKYMSIVFENKRLKLK